VEYSNGNYSGSCTYVETRPQSKIQSGTIYLLTHSDMGDVIEYIHKKTPLTSDDFNEVQMGIREHSHRKRFIRYIKFESVIFHYFIS
jgi:hypothetical protein